MEQKNDEVATKKRKLDTDEIKSLSDVLSIRAGSLNIDKNKKISLTVNNVIMDAMKMTDEDYAYLDRNLDVAYFLINNKIAYDPNICKYKRNMGFKIDLDIKSILKKINVEGCIDLGKVNYYKTGDFCLGQRNTSYDHGLIGTLVLLLPSEYVGGELCFGDYNVEKNMNKSTLRFIYFNSGLEHSITKVFSGNRLSLVYNIYDPNYYHQQNVIVPDKIDIYFPDEHYQKLLDYTIKYCEEKTNILLGNYKHLDDEINKRLRRDIRAKYDVIKVAVSKKSSIDEISTVYELKKYSYKFDHYSNEPTIEENVFSDLVDEEFEVQHKLFIEHCVLKYNEITLVTSIEYRRKSKYQKENSLGIYTAYLINPKFCKSYSKEISFKYTISVEESSDDDNDGDDNNKDPKKRSHIHSMKSAHNIKKEI